MDCTRPVGEIEGWGWWSWALNVMPFSCHQGDESGIGDWATKA